MMMKERGSTMRFSASHEFEVVASPLGWDGIPAELKGHDIRTLGRVRTETRPGRKRTYTVDVLRVRHDPEDCAECRRARRMDEDPRYALRVLEQALPAYLPTGEGRRLRLGVGWGGSPIMATPEVLVRTSSPHRKWDEVDRPYGYAGRDDPAAGPDWEWVPAGEPRPATEEEIAAVPAAAAYAAAWRRARGVAS
jgi:hypothetical protein